ncbi:MAG: glycosyltransferase family 2 protein [Chloroflexi bacterium]|nr:glycosyltransferase family 2 protein [Chloroflexota bacterium]
MPGLTVIILTFNEERHLPDCLRSVAFADEIIVLDSFSTDRTVEVAQRAGVQVVQHAFRDYADQRNYGLTLPAHPWLLYVDADERATEALVQEVRQVIIQEDIKGWWVPRQNILFGHWIRHTGWYPDYQFRLFQPRLAHYLADRPVHELVQVEGPSGNLQSPLLHYNYDTVGEFWDKQKYYSRFDAQSLFNQNIPVHARHILTQPFREFYRRYVGLKGYADGRYGLLLSVLMAYFEGLKYARAWQLQRKVERQT